MKFSNLVVLVLCVSLVGCGSSAKRTAAFPPVRVVPLSKEMDAVPLYGDKTTQAAGLTGAMFGIVRAVVGASVAAASQSSGQKRFRSVTGPHRAGIKTVVQKVIERNLSSSGKLPASKPGAKDAEVRLTWLNYGVTHTGQQRFAAIIMGRYEIWDASGKRILKNKAGKTGRSTSSWTSADYNANPRLYTEALSSASEALGRQIADEVVEELEWWYN